MIKETRPLPDHTYMVETERGIIFVHAVSYLLAEKKAKKLGYKSVSSYKTIEVIM